MDYATNCGFEPPSGPKGLAYVETLSRVSVRSVLSLVDRVSLRGKLCLPCGSLLLARWAMAHGPSRYAVRLITCDHTGLASTTERRWQVSPGLCDDVGDGAQATKQGAIEFFRSSDGAGPRGPES